MSTNKLHFWLLLAACAFCLATTNVQTTLAQAVETEAAADEEFDVQEAMREAQGLMQDRDLEAALEVLEKVIKADEKNYDAMMAAAQVYMQHGVEMATSGGERKPANKPLRRGAELMRKVLAGKGELRGNERQLLAISLYNEACCAAVDEDADEAFKVLREAMSYGFDDIDTLEGDSDFDAVRDDDRFDQILEEMEKALESGDNDGDEEL